MDFIEYKEFGYNISGILLLLDKVASHLGRHSLLPPLIKPKDILAKIKIKSVKFVMFVSFFLLRSIFVYLFYTIAYKTVILRQKTVRFVAIAPTFFAITLTFIVNTLIIYVSALTFFANAVVFIATTADFIASTAVFVAIPLPIVAETLIFPHFPQTIPNTAM